MKKGVVLLVTMGFIVALIGLIAYLFSLSDRMFDRVNQIQKRDQSAVLFSDVKGLIDSYAKDVKSDDNLSVFLSGVPPFYDSKSGLELEISMTSLSDKININSILLKGKIDKNIKKYIENICETYNVLDPSLFISIILDTIDIDDIAREVSSEISLVNTKFSNGSIFSKKQFDTLLNYYARIAQDQNIFKIPWDKLIYFGGLENGTVDCNRMSKEMVWALGLDGSNYIGCEDLKSKENKKIATKYKLKEFDKEDNYYILVKIYYQVDKISDRVSFIYDIKTHKASNFELL